MEKILQIQNLVKQFGQNTVLHGINLEIEKGQVACLIGPSGSGKSTPLRCINLLEMPNGGQVPVPRSGCNHPAHRPSPRQNWHGVPAVQTFQQPVRPGELRAGQNEGFEAQPG